MYFPYSLNSRNYARTGVIHQLSALCFVFSAAHAAPSNAANHRQNKDAARSGAALFCPSEFALLGAVFLSNVKVALFIQSPALCVSWQ